MKWDSRIAQGGGAVGGVKDRGQAGRQHRLHDILESVQLEIEEIVVFLVSGGEVGHDAGQLDFRRGLDHVEEFHQLARVKPQASHAGIDLDVASARLHRGRAPR